MKGFRSKRKPLFTLLAVYHPFALGLLSYWLDRYFTWNMFPHPPFRTVDLYKQINLQLLVPFHFTVLITIHKLSSASCQDIFKLTIWNLRIRFETYGLVVSIIVIFSRRQSHKGQDGQNCFNHFLLWAQPRWTQTENYAPIYIGGAVGEIRRRWPDIVTEIVRKGFLSFNTL